MDQPEACTLPDFTDITGPYLIGHLLSFTLFGVLCLQIYYYFDAFHKHETRRLRSFVYLVFALEVIFQGIEFNAAYASLGSGWGQPPKLSFLTGFPKATFALSVLTGLVTFLVHGFYAWRIVALGRRYFPAVIVMTLSTVQLAMAISSTAYYANNVVRGSLNGLEVMRRLLACCLIFAAVTDVVVTAAMLTLLFLAHKHTSNLRTLGIVQKLMRYTVETGLVTSLAAIIDVILFLAPSLKDTNWHYVVSFCLSKIYANALVAILNSRMSLTPSAQWQRPQTESIHFQRPSQNYLWQDSATADVERRKSIELSGGMRAASDSASDSGRPQMSRSKAAHPLEAQR